MALVNVYDLMHTDHMRYSDELNRKVNYKNQIANKKNLQKYK